jgi:hypothetical protein
MAPKRDGRRIEAVPPRPALDLQNDLLRQAPIPYHRHLEAHALRAH